jgi:hypothetical protein
MNMHDDPIDDDADKREAGKREGGHKYLMCDDKEYDLDVHLEFLETLAGMTLEEESAVCLEYLNSLTPEKEKRAFIFATFEKAARMAEALGPEAFAEWVRDFKAMHADFAKRLPGADADAASTAV